MMNKKNLKLIMELIFIFILPLVFICFTSEIQVEREFTYDNQGNYEVSQDIKQLSFDNSIIKYTKTINNEFKINDYIIITDDEIEINYELMPDKLYSTSNNYEDYEDIFFVSYINNPSSRVYEIYFEQGTLKFINNIADETYNIYEPHYDNYENIDYLIKTNNYTSNYDYQNNYTSTYFNNIFYYLTYKNTIWGNIKELLIDNLDLNDNVLLDIIICYMVLWVINWIIWHLYYGLLELLWHIIPRKE